MEPSSAAITAAAWAWEKYGESLTGKAVGALKDRWDKFRWKEAAEAYRAKIKKLYGAMQIMGMAEPIPLDGIFTDTYMLDRPTALRRFDIESLKQLSADPDKPPGQTARVNGLRLVRGKGNLFILGKPGAGKTTFLQYIALQAAEQNIDKTPIFVSLREWAVAGSPLLPFIAERFDICDFPDALPFVEEILKDGAAIVLFDGLDEVSQEGGGSDRQAQAMDDFIKKYDRAQCLVTCRIAASDYCFRPFAHVEIADFNERQIKKFVRNWFRSREGEEGEGTAGKLLEEFGKNDNKGLRDLARTPLLLTLLCLAFNETLTFPQRRVEIYEEALEALLKKWDSSRRIKRDEIYRKLSLGHKENMLARIAAEMFERNEYFISRRELGRRIADYVKNIPPHDPQEVTDGEVILKAIAAQHGILVERARDVYSFSHLSFQEYFTAKYLASPGDGDKLTNLVAAHCEDERWREVFLLTTSLLPEAGRFMAAFRRGVDELLGGDEKLSSLLAWADKKSASAPAHPWTVRPNYLFIELYYPSRKLGTDLSRVLDRALDRARNVVLDVALDLDRTLARALAVALDPDLAGHDPTRHAGDDRTLALENLLDESRQAAVDLEVGRGLGLKDLIGGLAELSSSTRRPGVAGWTGFAERLRALMVTHRDIGHEWDLTAAQEVRLADYLNAVSLLQECLALAYMPAAGKETIRNSLYLPPGRAGESGLGH